MDLKSLRARRVLRGEDVVGLDLSNVQVKASIVDSIIRRSVFHRVSTEHAFWGAGTLWEDCRFLDCRFSGLISPQNRFVRCVFEGCTFTMYRPCETTFLACEFQGTTFESLRASPNMRNTTIRAAVAAGWPYPEIEELDASGMSVLFRSCSLLSVQFVKTTFRSILMDACAVTQPRLRGCDLSGMVCDVPWWSDADQQDPFVYYLQEVLLAFSEMRSQSPTVRHLAQIITDLQQGQGDRNWLALLEAKGLSEPDFDLLEEITDRIPSP